MSLICLVEEEGRVGVQVQERELGSGESRHFWMVLATKNGLLDPVLDSIFETFASCSLTAGLEGLYSWQKFYRIDANSGLKISPIKVVGSAIPEERKTSFQERDFFCRLGFH